MDGRWHGRKLWTVYFGLCGGDIEAALSGADAYYWLVQGYGDPKRLAHALFYRHRHPMTGAFSSLTVQGYFLLSDLGIEYRSSWNARSSWLCWDVSPTNLVFWKLLTFTYRLRWLMQARRCGWASKSVPYTLWLTRLITPMFSLCVSKGLWLSRQLYMCAHPFQLKWPLNLWHFHLSWCRYRVPLRTFWLWRAWFMLVRGHLFYRL